MPEEVSNEGVFQCPVCWQKYETPETPLGAIRDHVRNHRGSGNERRTVRWVAGRIKPKQAEGTP